MRRNAQVALAVAMFLPGIALLAWGMCPPRRITQVMGGGLPGALESEALTLDDGSGARATEYLVTLKYPGLLRAGDSESVHVRIAPEQQSGLDAALDTSGAGSLPRGPNGNSDYRTPLIQARLEVSGASVQPEGDITAAWAPDQEVEFVWRLWNIQEANARGTAWTFLVPHESSTLPGPRIALSAQPLEIRPSKLLGISGPVARIIGGALVAIASTFAMPTVERALRRGTRGGPGR
jgi:hypothetical protein